VSENETPGICAYDLTPGPALIPNPSGPGARPRYVPAPQPEGTVRVVLDDRGCNGEPADFQLYDEYPVLVEPYRVFDVPQEQYERWLAAKAAFGVMEEEIESAVSDRARNPRPAPPPGLPG
jgi:hypothetical protein